MRRDVAAVVLGLATLGLSAGAAAASKTPAAATLAPACEAFMTKVLASDDPGSLPVVVLADPAPKAGPYRVTAGDAKVGDVKVDTVLTGWMEYQDGPSRARTPFFCLGRGKKVGYYYACQRSARAPDRLVLPVRECRARSEGDEGTAACLRRMLAASESALAGSAAAAGARAVRKGSDAVATFQESEREFVAYRARSCAIFEAPDAATDATDFLVGCFVRLNTTRTRSLDATR